MLRIPTALALTLSLVGAAHAFPPGPPPVIDSITPGEVDVLLGGVISIHGDDLLTTSYIDVGPDSFWSWELIKVTKTLIQFEIPLGKALGPTPVAVWTSYGVATGSFSFVPNDPPALIGPTLIQNGKTHKWWTAGEPNQAAFLLVNLTGQTVPVFDHSLLAYDLLVPYPQTIPTGVQTFEIPVTGLPVGLQLWMQYVTLAPPGNDASTLKVSNLLPLTVGA